MTQEDLAEASGVNRTLISKAENNRVVLPLGSLSHLAQALGVSLMELLNGVESTSPVAEIIRRQDYEAIEREGSDFGYSYQKIFSRHSFAVVRVRVPAGQVPPQQFTHREREFGYVLTGRCVLLYGTERYPLAPGDSYWIDGNEPHVLVSEGEGDCLVMAIFVSDNTAET